MNRPTDRRLLILEALAFVATLILAAVWFYDPAGNWEPLTVLCGLTTVGAELYRQFARRSPSNRFQSNAARVQHREALRKRLQEEIYRCRAEKLREDVIVRNVDRLDSYPHLDDNEPGISPWFRVGLADTYEKGIVLCLRIGSLKKCPGGYRYVDHVNKEGSDVKAWLMANVPYDSIAEVNMDGDKYYPYPHIFCHFDFDGEPYEKTWFAAKEDLPHGHPYYKLLATYGDVIKNNPAEGQLYFG